MIFDSIKLFTITTVFIFSMPLASSAQELTGKSAKCIDEKNPESLCIDDECVNLCRKNDSNLLTSLFYFNGILCPEGFTELPNIALSIDDKKLSACKTNDPEKVTANNNNPNRVRFFIGEECPIGQTLIVGTGSASFCQPKSGVVFGCVKGNCINGKGEKIWSNGMHYVGGFKNGLRHGNGVLKINGSQVTGQFKKGLIHGQAVFTYPNGDVFDGEWQNGLLNGKATGTYSDKTVYVGEWKDSIWHGLGKRTDANGDVYEGEWQDGKFWQGMHTYKTKYTGDLVLELDYENGSIKDYSSGAKDYEVAEIDPKKYWEGALNCFRYSDNPLKDSQRPYLEELLNAIDLYKGGDKFYKHNIIEYSTTIVTHLGCPWELFE